jgi:tetratricopeptide (TPR) repeat protein
MMRRTQNKKRGSTAALAVHELRDLQSPSRGRFPLGGLRCPCDRAQNQTSFVPVEPQVCSNNSMARRNCGFVRFLLRIGLLILAANSIALAHTFAVPETPILEQHAETLAHQGVHQMMDGDLRGAITTFRQIEKEDPSSPLGYLLEADATWWKIYYSTANLIDPDVFDVVSSDTTPYDGEFENLVRTTTDKAQERIREKQDIARSYLYEGMAYALEGRLAGLRAKDLATARAGKKMHSLLLTAITLDPHLTDAYAGLGLYNYFVATLPAIVRVLRFFIGLPGGNREEGIQQLYNAAEHGTLVRAEAKFYLAKDFTRKGEMQFSKSLELFQQLAQEFPDNPFWKLMVASVYMRLGQRKVGETMYRQVLAQTAAGDSILSKAVHRQVAEALDRLHPGEKFE